MNMANIDDVFGGNTLKSEDIKGRSPVVTIENVVPKQFTDKDGTTKKKLMITFVNSKKALVCNVTNARRIAHLYGPDYEEWPGRKIKLQVEMVDFGGRITDGIRVHSPVEPATEPAKPKPAEKSQANDDMDSDIPF